MKIDAVLPCSLFLIVNAILYVNRKIGNAVTQQFNEQKLGKHSVILLICTMGVVSTILAFLPNNAFQIMYLVTLSILLFSFVYLVAKKWSMAIGVPSILLLLYFFYWDNLLIFNFFAVILGLIITIFLSLFFSWNNTLLFTALLTLLDVIQVFATGIMGQIVEKVLQLELPVLIVLPTYPTSGWIALGVGDIFLSGLLAIQTAKKYEYTAGRFSAVIMSVGMFIFELFAFNTGYVAHFPATVVIVLSWMISVVITHLRGHY
ncbi:MAG: hypothetical protein JSV76_07735 [Candidatus Bathyarchaeota archaeon]|nr:MAG: hypothetical protein JSV76_07735 [Candidatus Bathyarchaeota archaeon]